MQNSPSAQNFSLYPMLWIATSFAGGIALAAGTGKGIWIAATVVVAVTALSLVRPGIAGAAIPVIFVPLGIACYLIDAGSVADDRIKKIYDTASIASGEPVEIEGVVRGHPEPAYGGYFLRMRVERLTFRSDLRSVSGDVRLFATVDDGESAAEYAALDLRYGSRVKVAIRLEREERFRNPGVASRIDLLDQQGIDATGTLKSLLLIEKLGEDPVFRPLSLAYDARKYLIDAFRQSFSEETAGVMIASLLGDKYFLDRNTAEIFREGGTFHVLVISGLHITFIGGLTLWFVSFLTNRNLYQFLLATSFLWAYTFAVGAEIPVVRASVMFTILLLARVIERRGTLLNALGVCTIILLVWRPSDLFSASFQLTFVSVAAIVACAFPMIEKLRSVGRWCPSVETPLPPTAPRPLRRFCELLYWNEEGWRIENRRQIWSANLFKSPYLNWINASNFKSILGYVFEGVLVSVIVQFWMLPLLVVYFHRVSPASVFLNLWVGIFLAIESFAALFGILLSGVSLWLAAPLILLTELLNQAMMSLPAWTSTFDGISFRSPVYSGYMKLIYWIYAVAVIATAFRVFKWDPFTYHKRYPRVRTDVFLPATATLLAFVVVFHPFSAPRADGRLRVNFLDVGQGDSTLVTLPNGETILVDGGGSMDFRNDDGDTFEPDSRRIGEFVVSEFLWEKGYDRVDYLVATHSDADHIQGLTDVANNFRVGALLVSAAWATDPKYSELLDVINARNVDIRQVARGDILEIGGTTIEILHPTAEASGSLSSNDSSIVIRLKFGSTVFLLTGDIEQAAEHELVSHYDSPEFLRAEVVKVPHHGSRTSSTDAFVKRTDSRVAIVSVGRKSRFGHPHRDVVARWLTNGAEVITTGEKGTITITTHGNGIEISSFVR